MNKAKTLGGNKNKKRLQNDRDKFQKNIKSFNEEGKENKS